MATPRSGRPTAVQTPDMIEKVRELISTYRRMSLRMMVKELEISRVTIRKISENGRSELGLFPTVWPMNRRLPDCELVKSLCSLLIMTVPRLNCNGWRDMVFPVWSQDKKTTHGMALAKLFKTKKNSHSSTVWESFTKNSFHHIRQWIRNITWKYCHIPRIHWKTSISGKRQLAPLARQCKTSHCSISKTVFGKTSDSRIKSPPHILLTYAHAERRFEGMEDIKRYVTKDLLALHAIELKKYFEQFYEWAQKCETSPRLLFRRILKVIFDFKCSFLKVYLSWNLTV